MRKIDHILNLTYLEKISVLYNYYEKYKNIEPEKAVLAKNMSNIIYLSIKLNDPMPIEIIDEILNLSAKTAPVPHFYNPPKLAENGVTKILAKFKPEIKTFTPSKSAYDKVEILKKYVNHEMDKQKANTCKFCLR